MEKKQILSYFIEFLIWLFVVGFILVLSVLVYNFKIKQNTQYYVFMKDVDGLTIGSPVKFMGKQIGYINNLSAVDSNVYVTFLVDNGIKLPQNSSITVEFYGIAGSKSLEIMPPTSKPQNYCKMFEIRRNYRIYNFYNNQMNLSAATLKMSNNSLMFLKDSQIKSYKKLLKDELNMAKYIIYLENINNIEDEIIKYTKKHREKRKNNKN